MSMLRLIGSFKHESIFICAVLLDVIKKISFTHLKSYSVLECTAYSTDLN